MKRKWLVTYMDGTTEEIEVISKGQVRRWCIQHHRGEIRRIEEKEES